MKVKNHTKINTSIIFTIFLLVTLILFGNSQVLAQYKTGSPAPHFKMEGLDGEIYQLNQFNNKQSHLVLYFIKSDDSASIGKLQDMVNFFEDYQPKESYQIIVVAKINQDQQEAKEKLLTIQENTKIPLLILLDDKSKVMESYQIERYPTILLLRTDLQIHKIYDGFNTRQERSFYQYLGFIFTSQKNNESSENGCDDDEGVCPPPPGY